jgi:SAM-dependent methyltransferase
MLAGPRGELFPPLEKADHFPYLNRLVQQLPQKASLLDLGCGAAAFSKVYKEFFYTGADMAGVIEKVALKHAPEAKFVEFDVYSEEDYEILEVFDVILMNALIDVLEYPIQVLENVLARAPKYVLLHRQELFYGLTRLTTQPSYGGITFHSIINEEEFLGLFDKHRFKVLDRVRIACYSENVVSVLARKEE